MNEGWVFGDGVFYTKYEKDALAECRKDRDAILHDIETLTAEDIQDPYTWDEFATARQSALQNVEDDHELMTIAFQTDYCYYTEWVDEDDFYESVLGDAGLPAFIPVSSPVAAHLRQRASIHACMRPPACTCPSRALTIG